ncbi:methyl-accepting chemotaxis protein, partial [Desulfosarcina sp.]|uniref:methyl-accepting chemotaxis protein n=1 Tax=Desulfosarcina sp. TaxID=2027861 RepID=UPI0039706615
MFKNMKLSAKLIGSFVIVAVITLAVGFVGWRGVNGLSHHIVEIGEVRLPSIHSLMVIEKEAESVIVAQRTLLNPDLSREHKAQQFENIQAARNHYEAAWKVYEPLPQTPEEAQQWNKFVPAWEAWRHGNNEFLKLIQELDKLDLGNPDALNVTIEMIRGDHYKLMSETSDLVANEVTFQGGEDHLTCGFGKWVAGFKTQNPTMNSLIAQITEPHHRFHQAVADIKAAVGKGNLDNARHIFRNALQPAAQGFMKGLYPLREEAQKATILFDQASQHAMVTAREKETAAIDLLEQIVKINEDAAHVSSEEAAIESGRSKTIAIIGMIAGFLAALAFGIFLSISINRALKRIIEGLSEGADQVAAASSQVSSASQSLAEGSSEQAASIEETSSSLEEMSSMTRQNADNASQADTLMKEANQVVTAANQSMGELTRSMVEISKASEETSKIIKTIDEIAFQTNLLALNAAVEAARAGEAGAGFAVVADEVRNLAMRAADAAKNTANLIEGTVKQVKEGGELVGRTNDNFSEVAKSSAKVGELVAEIAAASSEQAQGISQVNTAVNEVDKVTQQNAANAEESASASEEMNAQAEQMKVFVAELVAMVGSSSNGNGANGNAKPVAQRRRTQLHHTSPHLPAHAGNGGKAKGNRKAKAEMP